MPARCACRSDLALIALGLDAVLLALNIAMLLLPGTDEAAQIRRAYAQAGVPGSCWPR